MNKYGVGKGLTTRYVLSEMAMYVTLWTGLDTQELFAFWLLTYLHGKVCNSVEEF